MSVILQLKNKNRKTKIHRLARAVVKISGVGGQCRLSQALLEDEVETDQEDFTGPV